MTTFCKWMAHEWLPGLVGSRMANGIVRPAHECRLCGHVEILLGVKMRQEEATKLVIRRDRTGEADLCARCGSSGTEMHHWAPREIFGFDDAETWPQDPLCRPCHTEWHRRMRSWKP